MNQNKTEHNKTELNSLFMAYMYFYPLEMGLLTPRLFALLYVIRILYLADSCFMYI